MQCLKCSSPMKQFLTRKGVLVDVCSSCKGVWLDQGEINFFTKNRKILYRYETKGLEVAQNLPHKCPKCQSESMRAGRIPGLSFQVEECSSCHGIYLDAPEFKKFQKTKGFQTIRPDRSGVLEEDSVKKPPSSFPVKFPSLALTTGVVCFSLYGILFAFIVFLMELGAVSLLAGSGIFIGFILLQFYFSPIFLDWQLKFFGSLTWTEPDHLPSSFKDSLFRLCKENRIPIPRMGIINDDSPQAYTYGRTPYSARVVFSRGMFKILDDEEVEAILAHELGHIKHWDFVIMTVMKLVPLLLYMIYTSIYDSIKESSSSNKKGGNPLAVVLVVAYVFYLISEYLVLFISRVREYYADRFSCFATKKPNKLLTGLVKVSYGLLSSRSLSPANRDKKSYENKRKGVEALNIMSVSYSKQLALACHEEKGDFNPQTIEEIMRWDLWSPWALYYEFKSTHPLTAKRINAIGSYALSLKQKPYVLFTKKKPESYWDDFFVDIGVLLLPYIFGIIGACVGLWAATESGSGARQEGVPFAFFAASLFGLSLGAFIRTLKAYPSGKFLRYSIASLLKCVKVSPVRSYPVFLKGHILGRGDAGNIFSEDMVLQDQTGMIFLNHEPFGLNVFFALMRYKKFRGKEVKLIGWYRRSPTPYVEVKKIQTTDETSKAYTYHYKIGFCLLGFISSFICFLLSF